MLRSAPGVQRDLFCPLHVRLKDRVAGEIRIQYAQRELVIRF
jgi:hypothetical protein